MAGNSTGGKKAAATNKLRHGEDFYKKIGSDGGIAGDGRTKGFAHPDIDAAAAGRKGFEARQRNRAAQQ